MTPIPFTFRLLPGNRFTLPLLLSIIENSRWSRLFNLSVAGSARELLSRHAGQQPGIAAYSFITTEWPVVWREKGREMSVRVVRLQNRINGSQSE